MSLKLECHSNWNVTQNWIFIQIRVSLKYERHSNFKTKRIEKVVNPKTSKSASIGLILIMFLLDSWELANLEIGNKLQR